MRTYDKKEIDFILTLDAKPILAIEAKLGDSKFPPQLRKFRGTAGRSFPIMQVINQTGVFLRRKFREHIVGYDRLLMVL